MSAIILPTFGAIPLYGRVVEAATSSRVEAQQPTSALMSLQVLQGEHAANAPSRSLNTIRTRHSIRVAQKSSCRYHERLPEGARAWHEGRKAGGEAPPWSFPSRSGRFALSSTSRPFTCLRRHLCSSFNRRRYLSGN